jgi:hypothetical protein
LLELCKCEVQVLAVEGVTVLEDVGQVVCEVVVDSAQEITSAANEVVADAGEGAGKVEDTGAGAVEGAVEGAG